MFSMIRLFIGRTDRTNSKETEMAQLRYEANKALALNSVRSIIL